MQPAVAEQRDPVDGDRDEPSEREVLVELGEHAERHGPRPRDARELMRCWGGDPELANRADGGARATLRLPLYRGFAGRLRGCGAVKREHTIWIAAGLLGLVVAVAPGGPREPRLAAAGRVVG